MLLRHQNICIEFFLILRTWRKDFVYLEKHFLGNIGVTNTVQNFMDRNAFYPKEIIKESRYRSLHFLAGQKNV